MSFKKYQHLERLGTAGVNGIEKGECYIFPKLDGANASLWCEDGFIRGGSRNRELSLEEDNRGFLRWSHERYNFFLFFKNHPNYRLFGEWLVPHSLKTYDDSAWNKFYVFDVVEEFDNGTYRYLPYSEYVDLLKEYSILYIPLLKKILNPNLDELEDCIKTNHFLMKGAKGLGEGIVIKNYDFKNQFGRVTWAKLISSEFNNTNGRKDKQPKQLCYIEDDIVSKYITKAFCEKEYEKFIQGIEFSSNMIGGLLTSIYNEFIQEEGANIIFEFSKEVIDIKRLRSLAFKRIKKLMPNQF